MKKLIPFIVVLVAFLMTACNDDGEKLYVYNWGDYMDMDVVKEFEEEYNVKVIYQEFATNEDLYVKIKNSSEPMDVIFPSEYMLERMSNEGLLNELDFSKLDNFKYVDKDLTGMSYDKENKYSVPFFWGTVGIIYNSEKYPEGLQKWADLWNEKYKKDMVLYYSQRDILMVALKKLGYSMNTSDEAQLEDAKNELIDQKPLVYAYLGDEIKDILIAEDANVGVVYSGDAGIVIEENPKYKYVLPKEGTNLWFDVAAIPKNARNVNRAHDFINFLLRPEIAARNAEYLQYATVESEAKKYLPESLVNNEALYPDRTNMTNFEIFEDPSQKLKLYDRIWTEFQSGYKKK
ncbi:ABC transporter substrate-binding protein [Ezakiella coagulans]|uniref:ABC transporter substrate-binding protein n=1 Tax=Ezakiella coagulans TaxID=46507 RepID=UPI0020148ADA|nr:spermidine/putrescine ABC transporter substrate-binding protein [Ezakiella coagulans]UQK60493.1 spermidine/putrescine ABC transporter substrate-binding protein [Ezakiella coagulans]